MNVFSRDNWNQMSIEEKKRALQELENDYAKKQGRPENPAILEFKNLDYAGVYYADNNTMQISNKMLVSGNSSKRYEVIDTVIHEGRHAYQAYSIHHPGTHPDQEEEAKWRDNELYYITPNPDVYKYVFQARERDAYGYAAKEMGRIFKDMPDEAPLYSQYEQCIDKFMEKTAVDAEANLGKDYLQKIDTEVAEKARMLRELKDKEKAAARIANPASPSAQTVSPEAITYDKIKLESPWEIQSIYELQITRELNQHATLYITARVTEDSGKKVGLEETVDEQVKIYIEDETEPKYIFKGRLQEVSIHQSGAFYILTASFKSQTSMLDSQRKSRSFQDTSLNYSDIVAKILADYPDKDFELTAEKMPINGPLIQYQETDWEFIKRIASYQETIVVPDIILDQIVFSFGYPAGGDKTLPENIKYISGKDIAAYNIDWAYNPELILNEYTYYEVESFWELNLGDKVTFQNYELYVGAVTIELKDGILIYTAKLVRKLTLRQNPIYNEKIQGVSLEGKVLALQNQEIKLHLDIDQEQDEGTAYWYPFVPPTTDMMYLMPQIGTNASLYIPGLHEQNAIITGSVRTNGGGCEKTGDPNTRYLGTEYGQELKLAPGGIYITAGKSNLVANFDDEEGVKLSSHKKLILEAEQEIIIESQKTVSISAASQILIATPSAAISMENETHFLAAQTHITCTDEAPFPEVEQPEQEQEEQEQETAPATEESQQGFSINWGAVIVGAVAAAAVVAVASVTFGIGAPLALAAIGAAAGTIAYMAKDDVDKGSFSGVEKYIEETIKTIVVTLIVGAMMGPMAAAAGTGFLITRLMDGIAGGLSSGVDGVLFGDGIDVDNMELSFAMSAAMGSVKLAKGAGKVKTRKPLQPNREKWIKNGGKVDVNKDGTVTYTNKDGQPVTYNKDGYPDFTPYAHPTVEPVEIEVANPTNRPADFKAANEAAKLDKNSNPPVMKPNEPPEGYTWHHHEDGKTMILIDENVHKMSHTGGVSTVKNNSK